MEVRELFLCVSPSSSQPGLGGGLSTQRGAAPEWADRGRAADAPQRAPQPDGHREGPHGLEQEGGGQRAPFRHQQVRGSVGREIRLRDV